MSQVIHINQITTGPDRQRKVFSDRAMEELANDIKLNGLLHPLVVVRDTETTVRLVAGERRLRAIKELYKNNTSIKHDGKILPPNGVPVTLLGDESAKSELQLREAELSENIQRMDLTWQERTTAVAELHALRKAQNPQQTIVQTATEVFKPEEGKKVTAWKQDIVSRAVIIADFLGDDEIQKAQNERQAFRLVSQKLQKMFVESVDRTTRKESPHRLIYGDMRQELQKLPAGKFACVLTDPPYGADVEHFGNAAGLRHKYSEDNFLELYQHLISQLPHLCQPYAHAYIFCDLAYFHLIADMFDGINTENDWRVREKPLIWPKGSLGHLTEGSVNGFRASYETILVATRGKRSFTTLMDDVLTGHPSPPNKQHAAEKPVSLYKQLLKMSCQIGDHVLDPFAGSGPIFPAAAELDLKATGIEQDLDSVRLIEAMRGVYHERTEVEEEQGIASGSDPALTNQSEPSVRGEGGTQTG